MLGPLVGEIRRVVALEAVRVRFNGLILFGITIALAWFAATATLLFSDAATIGHWLAAIARRWPDSMALNPRLAVLVHVVDPRILDMLASRPGLVNLAAMISIIATPSLIMLIASDQIGSELTRRHIRFVIPRVSRRGLYLGRAAGAWLTWCALVVLALPIVGCVTGSVDPNSGLVVSLGWSLWAALVLCIYALPFVALMSLTNATIPQPFLAYLAASSALLVLGALAGATALIDPAYGVVRYLSPTSMKYLLITPNAPIAHTGTAVVALLAYTVVFLLAGDWIVHRRDV